MTLPPDCCEPRLQVNNQYALCGKAFWPLGDVPRQIRFRKRLLLGTATSSVALLGKPAVAPRQSSLPGVDLIAVRAQAATA